MKRFVLNILFWLLFLTCLILNFSTQIKIRYEKLKECRRGEPDRRGNMTGTKVINWQFTKVFANWTEDIMFLVVRWFVSLFKDYFLNLCQNSTHRACFEEPTAIWWGKSNYKNIYSVEPVQLPPLDGSTRKEARELFYLRKGEN